nr:RNA-directed DNA polymerase, eukaryota [Tanacetum cinerariifolium]
EVDQDFVSEERIAWVDIKGVPIRAWSVETFSCIGKKWGELLNIEDTSEATFGRKRVCILTKNSVSILESFKIIVKGKVCMIRAKELFTWSPNYLTNKETECSSDDESIQSENHILKHSNLSEEEEREFKSNDVEGVTEIIFGGNSVSDKRHSEEPVTQESGDPFKILELLNKNKSRVKPQVPSPSLSHPPGFSPVGHESKLDKVHENREVNEGPGVDSLAQNEAEFVKSPQLVRIEGSSSSETKMDTMSHMDVKFMWGNSNYDFVCSDSFGSSGRILCIWKSSIFKKDNVTISDNFVAIYGIWLTNNVKELDSGLVLDDQLARRLDLKGQLHDINDKEVLDRFQKSKVRWAIEGDENSSFFHGIINKKRSQLAIRGILVDGSWQSDPHVVKEVFRNHFAARFKKPNSSGPKINYSFPNKLSQKQVLDLEREVSRDEIRLAVWSCRDNKSPGPDGYTFEFFKKYWRFIGSDFWEAVEHFFTSGVFAKGCNSSFITLIPKSAFVSERQILDGPFIINELLHWCKRKNKRAMFFKVDFAKAYDSVRWDYLIDVLEAFGFCLTWCK